MAIRSRCLLAINKLDDFKKWLVEDGWDIEEPKGLYEVVRAKKSKRWLLIHQRMYAKQHVTVMEKDFGVVWKYLKSRKDE